MLGIAYMSALTTIRIPCHLEIARSGRSARNVLSDRNTFKFSFSSINKLNTDTCENRDVSEFYEVSSKLLYVIFISILTKTIVKSNNVQKLVKYRKNPSAIHLRNISITNIMQKPRLVQ